MKKTLFANISRIAFALLFLFTLVAHYCDGVGEWYALHLYPHISCFLSLLSSVIPISLEEILAVAAVLCLAVYIVHAVRSRVGWRRSLATVTTAAVGLYTWFYWGWGMNYYRYDIYQRTGIGKNQYEEAEFRTFLSRYTERLNNSYTPVADLDPGYVERTVKAQFAKVREMYGLTQPQAFQHPKRVMFNSLYSGVGVLGYMGPFFAESQLNAELLPSQLPFTYAHELSHLLGVSSEAEANYWAYKVCTASEDACLRYSGYFGIFGYVAANARRQLPEDDYKAWLMTVRSEVMDERKAQEQYWRERYSTALGAVQDKVYDFFLRRNKISSGRKNYAEVVGYIVSLPDDCWR